MLVRQINPKMIQSRPKTPCALFLLGYKQQSATLLAFVYSSGAILFATVVAARRQMKNQNTASVSEESEQDCVRAWRNFILLLLLPCQLFKMTMALIDRDEVNLCRCSVLDNSQHRHKMTLLFRKDTTRATAFYSVRDSDPWWDSSSCRRARSASVAVVPIWVQCVVSKPPVTILHTFVINFV